MLTKRTVPLLILFAIGLAMPATAQTRLSPAWSALRPGSMLKVVHADTAPTYGRLRSVSVESVSLTPCSVRPAVSCEESRTEINLQSIRTAMVSRRRFGHAVMRGALIGAGAGLLVGLLGGPSDENRAAIVGVTVGAFSGIGAATGALVGALVPVWQRLPPPLEPE